MKAIWIYLKMKWEFILFGVLIGLINPLAFGLFRMLSTEPPGSVLVALMLLLILSTLVVLTADHVIDFFDIFLPNARRLGVPVSIVYQLRYQHEFTDNMINIFCTPKWDELLKKAKNGTLK